MSTIYNTENYEAFDLEALDVDTPAWLDACGVTGPTDVAAISEGGCNSGACMPAVTYYKAAEIMAEHGDDVLEYLEDHAGDQHVPSGKAWSQLASYFLASAVELWCYSHEELICEALAAKAEEAEA